VECQVRCQAWSLALRVLKRQAHQVLLVLVQPVLLVQLHLALARQLGSQAQALPLRRQFLGSQLWCQLF
jgi:hypothetical protein